MDYVRIQFDTQVTLDYRLLCNFSLRMRKLAKGQKLRGKKNINMKMEYEFYKRNNKKNKNQRKKYLLKEILKSRRGKKERQNFF